MKIVIPPTETARSRVRPACPGRRVFTSRNVTAVLLGAVTWLTTSCAPAARAPDDAPAPATGPVSPSAELATATMLRRDLEAVRHPADGGGRAWIESEHGQPVSARVRSPGRFPIVFEVGPHGIAEHGFIFLQASPFWGWDTPQVEEPDAPGFTRVGTDAPGVTLEPWTANQQLLAIQVTGRGLRPGERVHIDYGAGRAGAKADHFAESRSPLWIAVDGDGDGVRAVVPDSPTVNVEAGEPARLLLTLPTVMRPGEPARLTVAVLDRWGNRASSAVGEVVLEPGSDGLELPDRVTLGPAHRGCLTVEVRAAAEGVHRVTGRGPGDTLEARSNPMLVTPAGPRVLWGDLHGHSQLSDGTGTPAEYYEYARDVAALDVAALTDHDHWGIRFLDSAPELWREIRDQTLRFHEPGRFVTILGYEWTSWIHGHRHVLYFDDDGDVLSSMTPEFESPLGLWRALEGRRAVTIAHHSAGGPVATNWEIPPDPVLEPVTEVVSVHGSSEAGDSPKVIYSAVENNFVRDALARGYRFGFIGSGDGHDGHPGLAHLATGVGGIAAILAEDLTRDAVLAALRARRVYATSGPRILLRTALGGRPMGSVFATEGEGLEKATLYVRVLATAPVDRLDVIRSGAVADTVDGGGEAELTLEWTIGDLGAGEYVYVRVVQSDGGMAWSSPVFIE